MRTNITPYDDNEDDHKDDDVVSVGSLVFNRPIKVHDQRVVA